MQIGEYLTSTSQKVVTCSANDSVRDVASKLKANGIGAMPVVSANGELIGMISERDLVAEFSKHGAELVNLKVEDVLTKSVIFMGPNAELSDAMETMNKYGFRHIPILSTGKLVGVVSIRDLLALALPHEGEIHQHPVLAVASK